MNAFANSLLHLLLSWMRALFSDVLSFAQGGDSGLIAWIGKHWIVLTLTLMAAGILTDGDIELKSTDGTASIGLKRLPVLPYDGSYDDIVKKILNK